MASVTMTDARKAQYDRWRRAARTVIAASRRDKDIRQEDLARKIGWSRTKLAKTERGRREIRFAELLLIAVAVGENPEDVIRRVLRW
jgi:transcriptional regulator with XRE-family HTH domain